MEIRSKPQKFILGDTSFGPADRYVENEKTSEIFLVAGKNLKNLVYPKNRYMERSLHLFKEEDVAQVNIRSGGKQKELIHKISQKGTYEGWADSENPETPKELYENWIRKLFSLRPRDYVVPEGGVGEPGPSKCMAPKGAETMAEITFDGKKKVIGFLSVYKRTDKDNKTEYFACTEQSDAVVTISKTQAENLLKDMQDLLPQQ